MAEYEEAMVEAIWPDRDTRTLDQVKAGTEAEIAAQAQEVPEHLARLIVDSRIAEARSRRVRKEVTVRKAVNAVFDDEEALNSLLHTLYVHEHAADADHDIHEHAQEFAARVLADLRA